MAFWKPGTKKPETPLSLEVDREGAGEGTTVIHNKFASLSLQHQRQRLPIFSLRLPLLYLVEHHATVIVVGHTGCGKTTQVPQYLLEAGWAEDGRQVACTQPRRIATQTVAARVALETGSELGGKVGYSIRFEDVTTKGVTKIKYLTDGVLLREMMEDPLLSRYSVIMVDEAHERGLNTDVLLGLLKKVQRRRRDLRLVIASATLNAKHFQRFFDLRTNRTGAGEETQDSRGGMEGMEAPASSLLPAVLSVEGKSHPVTMHYLQEPASDYVQTAVDTTLEIHRSQGPGDILVFLTGQEEIERAIELLTNEVRKFERSDTRLLPLPLYAGLPNEQQMRVFEPGSRGVRRVVVASNIAETSVTLEGVVYVIDCLFLKIAAFNPLTSVHQLVVVPESRANAVQRAGRAGRVRPGHCYRLCTEAGFSTLRPQAVPEMQRADLTAVVLQLKALGVDNVLHFDWLSPPPAEALVQCLELLFALGALDHDARLTEPLGMYLAELPLEVRLGKSLLVGPELGCAQEMLTVAALLSVQSPWISQRGEHRALDEAKLRFAVAEGDLVTHLNVFKAFQAAGQNPQWCGKNLLKHRVLARAADIRRQLSLHLRRLGLHEGGEAPREDRTAEALRRAITAGYFSNAVKSNSSGSYSSVRGGGDVQFYVHPNSVLHNSRPPFLVYHTSQQTSKLWIQEVTPIDPDWLTELAPHFYEKQRAM